MPDLLLPNPPPAPTISGTAITVEMYLKNPARVVRLMNNLLNQRFIADVIFGPGPQASGGAVVYDQVSENDLFLSRDVQEIAPGAEFPNLTDTIPTPKVAAVSKWGGYIEIYDEARDRNAMDVFARETTKLANTVVRKVDTVAFATLDAAPTLTATGADWTTAATNILAFIGSLHAQVNALDMGYILDTLIINTVQAGEIRGRDNLVSAMSDVQKDAYVAGGTVGRLGGLDILETNRVAPGTGWAVARRQVGGISDEVPLRTIQYRNEKTESTNIQSSRRLVPYVTDPKAAIQISGI